MADIIEVEARVGVTKNLGNYESVRLDYSARAVLSEEEKPGDTLTMLRKNLQVMVKKDINLVMK